MSDNMLGVLQDAIQKAGIPDWEIVYDRAATNPVHFEYDRLKEIGYKESSGIGLRIISGERLGFACTTDPTRVAELPSQALDAAPYGERAGFDFPEQGDYPEVTTRSDTVDEFTMETAIARGKEVIARFKEENASIQAGVDFNSAQSTRSILNSNGLDASYDTTRLGVVVSGILVDGDSIQSVYESHSSRRDDADLEALTTKVLERFRASERVVPLESDSYPVIFTSKALPSILAAIKMGAGGRTVQKGASPLCDRIGEQIVDPRITLTDDPLLNSCPANRPFDGEGLPSQKNTVVADGVLEKFLYDLQTAVRMNETSTASAGRGFSTPPAPSFSTLVMSCGERPVDELVGQVSNGILVDQVLGGGQSNLLMGQFSLNIDLGFKIENGEVVGRVKNAMVAGNVYEALSNVQATSVERQYYGGMITPTILFESLPIAARDS